LAIGTLNATAKMQDPVRLLARLRSLLLMISILGLGYCVRDGIG
jgi:hypothetical protein